jgi:hypothetical protein
MGHFLEVLGIPPDDVLEVRLNIVYIVIIVRIKNSFIL